MFNHERTAARRGRERRGLQRRRRRAAQVHRNSNPTTNQIQYTVNVPNQLSQQSKGSLNVTASRNELILHSRRPRGSSNYEQPTPRQQDSSGQTTYDIHSGDNQTDSPVSLNQQNVNDDNYANLREHHLCTSQTSKHRLMPLYSELGQHVVQQELERNFPLEMWRFQPAYEDPLRVIPELSGNDGFNDGLEGWDDDDRHSDTGATGGRTPDRYLD
ncbi:hypothetical protein F4806DRAFT_483320 [Annulohypoxylon nitens]|nr:hypothetical protein F4806DRAFT_483320 [Annulohypoxylon nitens]